MLNNPGISETAFSELQPLEPTSSVALLDGGDWTVASASNVNRALALFQARNQPIEIYVAFVDPFNPAAVETVPTAADYGFRVNANGSLEVPGNTTVYARYVGTASNAMLIAQDFGVANAEILALTA